MSETHFIERHPLNLDWARSQLERKPTLHERLLTRMRELPSVAEGLASSFEDQFMDMAALEPRSAALMMTARSAARTLAAIIDLASGARECHTVDLGFTTVDIEPFEARVNAQHWLRAFSYALIARDERVIERLVATEIYTLRRGASEGGVEMDGYHYIWVATLKSWRNGRDVVNHLIDLRRNTVPEEIHIAAPEMVGMTQALAMALAALLSDDVAVFNESLAAAVELHKTWWLKDRERSFFNGAVALEPLALACAAHDMGMQVTVTSDYLPEVLIAPR